MSAVVRSNVGDVGLTPPRAPLRCGLMFLVLGMVCSGEARAIPSVLVDAVPGDAVTVWFLAGRQPTRPPSETRTALTWASDFAGRALEIGLWSNVDSCTRMWIDALAAVSVILEYPHAVALFDVAAEPRSDGGHRLAGLHAALIIHTRGASREIERRIQHLLSTYTNSEETTLSSSQSAAGDTTFTLRDSRLPAWAVITWGQLGDLYVIAVGEGAFARVTETIRDRARGLGADEWFKKASIKVNGGDAAFALYLSREQLGRRSDTLLTAKVDRVAAALRLADVERGLWTFRYEGRAAEASGFLSRQKGDELVPIAGVRFLEGVGETVIPDQATRYTAIDCDLASLFAGLQSAYAAGRSPGAQEKYWSFWRELETNAGVSVERDILSPIGRPVIIHDYPRHALGLPLARTVVAPVSGDVQRLRERIDRLFAYLNREHFGSGMIGLRRDDDAVWYLYAGIYGPALTVVDRWLIIGFSPEAVRRNAAHLVPPAPQAPGQAGRTGQAR